MTNEHPNPTPTIYPLHIKLAAWGALTTAQIFASTILKLAHTDGHYTFSPQSSLVFSESIKLSLTFFYLLHTSQTLTHANRQLIHETQPRLLLHMLALAIIYCYNNALMFWLFARADPGSITLIKSASTILTAVLMYVWRRFTLSALRWMLILLQLCGLVVAQFHPCTGRPHLPMHVYAVLCVSLFNSTVANVWNEHVIKNFQYASLATKNVHLYFFGALLNGALFLYHRVHTPGTPPFLYGYSMAALGVVTSNAFIGIAINLVYKYADALVKNIATSTTTVVLVLLSAFFFGGRSDLMVFVGAAVVLLATFLYFAVGRVEHTLQQHQPTSH